MKGKFSALFSFYFSFSVVPAYFVYPKPETESESEHPKIEGVRREGEIPVVFDETETFVHSCWIL